MHWRYHYLDVKRWARDQWWIITKGYPRTATYDVDSYLSELIPQLVTGLKNWNNGHPPNITAEQWTVILLGIIEGFQAAERLIGEDSYYDVCDAAGKIWHERYPSESRIMTNPQDDMLEFDPRYLDIVKELEPLDVSAQQRAADMKLFHRGFILFHQHFFDLWD